MQSVFMDDLRRNLGEMTSSHSSALESYRAMVSAENPTLAFISVALGNASLAIAGYHMQSVVRNTPIFFSSLLKLVIGGIFVGILLWGFRSIAAYLAWRFFSSDDEEADIYSFLSVEGMSDFVFLPGLILYAVASFFGMGAMALGFLLFAKCAIMYYSYNSVCKRMTSLDRILCVISSFGTLIVLRGVAFVLFSV